MEFYQQVASLVNKDLETSAVNMEIVPVAGLDHQDLRDKLAHVIAYLLEHNFERLCNAMYRLDVSEKKFDLAMINPDKAELSYELADLVMEREMLKVKTRQLYKDGKL